MTFCRDILPAVCLSPRTGSLIGVDGSFPDDTTAGSLNRRSEGRRRHHLETEAVIAGRPEHPGEPLNPPMVPASNYRMDPLIGTTDDEPGDDHTSPAPSSSQRLYSRGDNNPTWEALETAMAALEGGGASLAFSSGMAAISAVLSGLDSGATVLAPADCYQGVAGLLEEGSRRHGWIIHWIPTDDTDSWLEAMAKPPDLAWLESPSNPMMLVADLPTICRRAIDLGVFTAVDGTFATPLLQQPLDLGATVSIHSATKFIGGHSDLLGGLVTTRRPDVAERLRRHQTLHGATMGTLEAFLALRGLRTLPLRLERAQASALELARRLQQHDNVTAVHYPGLTSDPGHERARRTMGGPGAMISFQTVGDGPGLDRAMSKLSLIVTATSLGGVETTAERRARLAGQEHIPQTLIRLSVGCEHVDDLWHDLTEMLDPLADIV